MEGVIRDPTNAARRLAPGMVPPPSGQSFESLITSEAEVWAASARDAAAAAAACSPFSPAGTAGGAAPGASGGGGGAAAAPADGGFSVALSGGSVTGRGALRAALVEPSGGSARGLALLAGGAGAGVCGVEPTAVLRHSALRAEWQRRLGPKERVPWRDFWYKLVQPQVRGGLGLDKRQGTGRAGAQAR